MGESRDEDHRNRLSGAVLGGIVENFEIAIQPSTFQVTGNRSVAGEIWIEVGNRPFPEARWNDFPVVILGWWSRSAIGLLSRSEDNCEFRFIDGPFRFVASNCGDGILRVALYSRDKKVGEEYCEAELVGIQLLRATGIVLKYCEQHGIENDDVRVLRRCVADLQVYAPD